MTLLVGIAIGCAGAAVLPLSRVDAQPQPGNWTCFVIDRFPDASAAANWSGAQDVTRGLNQVARHVPPGAVIAPQINPGTSLVCVKY